MSFASTSTGCGRLCSTTNSAPVLGFRKTIRPTLEGYRIPLLAWERRLLASVPSQLTDLLTSDAPESKPLLARLFPPAYNLDPEKNEEYERLMRQDLLERHLDAANVLAETCEQKSLTDEQFNGWMRAVNGMRLVLGTLLDLDEESDFDDLPEDDPSLPYYGLYRYLSGLLDEMIHAASGDIYDAMADDEGHDDEGHEGDELDRRDRGSDREGIGPDDAQD